MYFVFITGRGHIANYLQLFTSRFDAILGLLEAQVTYVFMHLLRLTLILFCMMHWKSSSRISTYQSCVSECTSRSLMQTRLLWWPLALASNTSWKLAGHPSKPIGKVTHQNCPCPGTVKAVYGKLQGLSSICQNPAVRSNIEKIILTYLLISPTHSLSSLMQYLQLCI